MSSRALSLATVLLLIGFGTTDAALAQATNLEAGKSPSQLFAQTCNACHKSPRGLLKTVAPGSLPGFLRQHYTTSSDMAGILASYLASNGAADTRYQARDGKDKKDGAKEKDAAQAPEHQGRRQRSQEAAKPEGEGAAPPEGTRRKRSARPSEDGAKESAREGAKESAKPEAANQPAPEGRKSRHLKKRGKPESEEAPKIDAAAPSADDKKGEAKSEAKPEPGVEPKAEPKSDSVKVEPSGSQAPVLRPDPVPQVTPEPPATAAKPAEPDAPKPVEAAAPKPAETTISGSSEPAAKPQDPPPAPTAAASSPAPAESSGPPVAPISR